MRIYVISASQTWLMPVMQLPCHPAIAIAVKIYADGLYAVQDIHVCLLFFRIRLLGLVIEAATGKFHQFTSFSDGLEFMFVLFDDFPFLACWLSLC